jgi:hypothetical protein
MKTYNVVIESDIVGQVTAASRYAASLQAQDLIDRIPGAGHFFLTVVTN